MNESAWEDLVIEGRSAPPRLSDDQFAEWVRGRPIFVSSPIDEEMTPNREAVRARLESLGAEPVMWEAITPQDRRPESAYLEGVDRSHLFVLLAGKRYGVSDSSGYSATHKEAMRAEERGTPRLLFERARLLPADRDGKLNDWLKSMYVGVSGATYPDPPGLEERLEDRLRDIAASQESTWVKLGRFVFPGQVGRRSGTGGSEYTARALLLDGVARHYANELVSSRYRGTNLLTWGTTSEQVNVTAVDIETVATSRDSMVIRMSGVESGGPLRTVAFGTISSGGRTADAAEQVTGFAEMAFFGADPGKWDRFMRAVFGPSGPTLPQVLATTRAESWLAEGLVRLFIVENLLGRFGGYFTRLDVGPATGKSIRLGCQFIPGGQRPETITIAGAVPLLGGESKRD